MKRVAVVGAGPAGLAAAMMLAEHGVEVVVLEKTASSHPFRSPDEWGGYRFHFGIHPFSTRNALLENLLKSLLGEDILAHVPTRAFWSRGGFVDYESTLPNVIHRFGLETASLGLAGYYLSRNLQGRSPEDLATWSSLTVGPMLHERIFDPLARKVWGLSSHALAAPSHAVSWPRPASLATSFSTVLRELLPNRWGVQVGETCYVPKNGWGRLLQLMLARVERKRGELRQATTVRGVHLDNGRFAALSLADGTTLEADAVVFSNPLPEWSNWLAPADSVSPAAGLHYRHLLFLGLSMKRSVPAMAYHTVDVGDPALPAVSLHAPNRWSRDPDDPDQLILEAYVAAHEPLWHAPDDEVLRQMTEGARALGLFTEQDVASYHLVRLPNKAPVHSIGYEAMRSGALVMADALPNVAVCGNGLFLHQGADAKLESGFRSAISTLHALGIKPASF